MLVRACRSRANPTAVPCRAVSCCAAVGARCHPLPPPTAHGAANTGSASHKPHATSSALLPSKTGKLKQDASFMHLEEQRKSELKTDWCLCLHVSA